MEINCKYACGRDFGNRQFIDIYQDPKRNKPYCQTERYNKSHN